MQIITGDALEVLKTIPDACCSTCVTSPPYYGLRNYGEEGQIGLEETPGEYIERLVEVFREVRRVLKNDGTLWLNIGDSYANDGKWGGSSGGKHAKALHGKTGVGRRKKHTGLKPKDLIGIPWLLAFALRADGWHLRADIIWQKPNAMPESVKDRPTRAHEYVFLLSKSVRYYYNAEAIKEPAVGFPGSQNPNARRRGNTKTFRGGNAYTHDQAAENSASVERESHGLVPNETGAPSGQSPQGHTRAHTSPHSRRNWPGPAYWQAVGPATPCWIPSLEVEPLERWLFRRGGTISG